MFTKIFPAMYDGSLRSDWKALVTFQQFLILSDQRGYVDMTPEAVHFRTGIPLDFILEGISVLASPDLKSRSREEDGRRLVLIDPERAWGWRVVNYDRYREIKTQDDLREYWRNSKRSRKAIIGFPGNGEAIPEAPRVSRKVPESPGSSASESASGLREGDARGRADTPTDEMAEAWRVGVCKTGAGYTAEETKFAMLQLKANGFKWAQSDWRAGLERQIQIDRERKSARSGDNPKPADRFDAFGNKLKPGQNAI